MSDETPDKGAVPGSPEADDSPTAEIPRVNRPNPLHPKPSVAATLKNLAASTSTSPEKPAEAATPAANKVTEARHAPSRTGARPTNSGAPKTDRTHKPVVKAGASKPKGDGVKSADHPLTAGDYARTTNSLPSTTSVIPVVNDMAPSPAQAAVASAGRQASLKLLRVDPWSVTKVVFALTVAMMIVAVVAVTILWIVLSIAGVWDQINSSVTTVLSDNSSSFDITQYVGFSRVVGLTLVVSAINVVITTAVATIGAHLYNLAAQLLGGVDVTLAEED